MTHPPNETREAPLDLDVATRIANDALACQLGTTTREAIDSLSDRLVEQIEAFFDEGLPEAEAEAAQQREEIQALLERAPDRDAPTFSAHTYMRALGRVLRRHIAQYEERHEGAGQEQKAQVQDGGSEPADPDAGQPSGMYRAPSGLTGAAKGRWFSLTGGVHL
ncbi:hypothetical protein [Streptomyces sp. NPDC014734]|uniref:hypothetical protein n=1 Tax=Streptomyces sp. NPDC014734 TaxID=3364886 RepID=UPI0036F4B68F